MAPGLFVINFNAEKLEITESSHFISNGNITFTIEGENSTIEFDLTAKDGSSIEGRFMEELDYF